MSDDQRQPDNRGPAIVVVGGVLGGFTFHGPFESIDKAQEWYEQSLFGVVQVPVTIALLEKPVWQDGSPDMPQQWWGGSWTQPMGATEIVDETPVVTCKMQQRRDKQG